MSSSNFCKANMHKKSSNHNEQLLMQSELTYETLNVQETEFILELRYEFSLLPWSRYVVLKHKSQDVSQGFYFTSNISK